MEDKYKMDIVRSRHLLEKIYDDRERFLNLLLSRAPERLRGELADILHDACLNFLEQVKKNAVPYDEGEARGYFTGILKNTMFARIRRKYSIGVDASILSGLEHDDDIFRFMAKGLENRKELAIACHEARETLDGEVADVMRLRFQEHLQISEIAMRLVISESTVKRRLTAGKERVRAVLVLWKLIQAVVGFGGIAGGLINMTDNMLENALEASYAEFPVGAPPSVAAINGVAKAAAEVSATSGGEDEGSEDDADPESKQTQSSPGKSLTVGSVGFGVPILGMLFFIGIGFAWMLYAQSDSKNEILGTPNQEHITRRRSLVSNTLHPKKVRKLIRRKKAPVSIFLVEVVRLHDAPLVGWTLNYKRWRENGIWFVDPVGIYSGVHKTAITEVNLKRTKNR